MLPTVSASFLLSLYVFCVRGKVPLKQGVNYFCPFAKTVIKQPTILWPKLVKIQTPLTRTQLWYLLSPLSPKTGVMCQCNKLVKIVSSTKSPKLVVSLIQVPPSELEK